MQTQKQQQQKTQTWFMNAYKQSRQKAEQQVNREWNDLLSKPSSKPQQEKKIVLLLTFTPTLNKNKFLDLLTQASTKNIPVYIMNKSKMTENELYDYWNITPKDKLVQYIFGKDVDGNLVKSFIVRKEGVTRKQIHLVQLGTNQENTHVVCSQNQFFDTIHNVIQSS
jgi:hypothetical protein